MSTRMGDSEKLIKRINALPADFGWIVEPSTDGWKIYNRNQQMFTVHKTYSDVRSLTNIRVDIEGRGGLKPDEAQAKRDRLQTRRDKLAADREAADRKAANMIASQQNLLVKAAGPYLVSAEEPDLQWLTTPHPSPWMRWMYITPKVAEHLLENYNSDNRKLSPDQAQKYALIIISGQWHLTHQGLAIDQRPMLQDGAHRLNGVVIAGQTDPEVKVPFAVFAGMPQENFKAIDEGRLRTAAQMLSKAGISGGTHLITCLRLIRAWDSPNPRSMSAKGNKLTNIEAFELVGKDPDGYAKAMSMGNRAYKATRITPGILASAYYLISRTNGADNVYVQAFFEGMIQNRKWNTRNVLDDDDPRQVTLNRFAKMRYDTPMDAVIWIIGAWNNLVKGHHPRSMRFNPGEMIQPLKCIPGQGAVPRGLAGEVEHLIFPEGKAA